MSLYYCSIIHSFRFIFFFIFFFFNDTATTEIYTLSLHDALPICHDVGHHPQPARRDHQHHDRSEEHTSELQSRFDLVCRLLLEKKKKHDYSLSYRIKKVIRRKHEKTKQTK